MHYFDQRGVYRVYNASLDQATWRYWRDALAPDFSQRFTGTFSDDGNTITGRGQLSRDGSTWDHDLALNYQRWRSAIRVCMAVTFARGWVTASDSTAAACASVRECPLSGRTEFLTLRPFDDSDR